MNLKNIIEKKLDIKIDDVVSDVSTYNHILDVVKNNNRLIRVEKDVLSKCKIKLDLKIGLLIHYYKSVIINYYENCMIKSNDIEKQLKDVRSRIKPFENKLKTVINNDIKTVYTLISYPMKNPAGFKFVCKVPITYGLLSYLHLISYRLAYYLEEIDDPIKDIVEYLRPLTNGRYGIFGQYVWQLRYNGISKISITQNSIVCEFYCDS